MLPLWLRLHNFLSYSTAEINFQGVNTVCICGNHGAGKSALIEAIIWVLWGQSRAKQEEDIIYAGANQVRVDFILAHQHRYYRVIRSCPRNHPTVLVFEEAFEEARENVLFATPEGYPTPVPISLETLQFFPLTGETLGITQQRIIETLQLHYDTFIHCAYIRPDKIGHSTQKYQNWQYQALQAQKSELQREFDQAVHTLSLQLETYQNQRIQLDHNYQALQRRLAAKPEIETALEQLQKARQTLTQLDCIQAKVAPLRQRQHTLHLALQRLQTQTETRLQELRPQWQALNTLQTQIPDLEQQLSTLQTEISRLDQLQGYRIQLREKGQERKSFLERLQAHQRDYEAQLQEMEQTQQTLNVDRQCPLCHHPLEDGTWERVQQEQFNQRQDLVDMLVVVADQLIVSEREIQVLREEYRRVDQDIQRYPFLLEKRGQLQQQLTDILKTCQPYQTLSLEIEKLEYCQKHQIWNEELQAELTYLKATLEQWGYDDCAHGLARGEVERWRWAEAKGVELQTLEREAYTLQQQCASLEAHIEDLLQQQRELCQGTLWQNLQTCLSQIQALEQHFEISPFDISPVETAYNNIPELALDIPTLEKQTNTILSHLIHPPLHVQLIPTDSLFYPLNIKISDPLGTRPSETYAQGEILQVNFALRLALAHLVHQHSFLPFLIIDEAFSPQDEHSLTGFLTALQTLAPDFSYMLIMTSRQHHLPQYAAAFQTVWEIKKTAEGSKVIPLTPPKAAVL